MPQALESAVPTTYWHTAAAFWTLFTGSSKARRSGWSSWGTSWVSHTCPYWPGVSLSLCIVKRKAQAYGCRGAAAWAPLSCPGMFQTHTWGIVSCGRQIHPPLSTFLHPSHFYPKECEWVKPCHWHRGCIFWGSSLELCLCPYIVYYCAWLLLKLSSTYLVHEGKTLEGSSGTLNCCPWWCDPGSVDHADVHGWLFLQHVKSRQYDVNSAKKETSSHCQLQLFSANLCVNICMNITRFNNWDINWTSSTGMWLTEME